jgi:hypothetical protein
MNFLKGREKPKKVIDCKENSEETPKHRKLSYEEEKGQRGLVESVPVEIIQEISF